MWADCSVMWKLFGGPCHLSSFLFSYGKIHISDFVSLPCSYYKYQNSDFEFLLHNYIVPPQHLHLKFLYIAPLTVQCLSTFIQVRHTLYYNNSVSTLLSLELQPLVDLSIKRRLNANYFGNQLTVFLLFFKQKCQTFAGSSFLIVRIFCFSLSCMMINEEYLDSWLDKRCTLKA